jgi:hypothetical protein
MSFKDLPQPYANLRQKHLIIDGPIHKHFFNNMFNNECIHFLKNVMNVLLQSSELELLDKLFFKTPWVIASCKSTAFIPKLLVPMSLVFNALSPQCCKPFPCLSFIYNSILSFLYTFMFSLNNYFGVC